MKKSIKRSLQAQIEAWLFRGKILILYGARQVGKTTLCKAIIAAYGEDATYLNCEIESVKMSLSVKEPHILKRFIGSKKIIILDEAQSVPEIGLVLKLLIDTYPEMQIIATSSSSFDLANRAAEPLTGRALQFELYPFSYSEMGQIFNPLEKRAYLDYFMRFGFYPEIAFADESDARFLLDNLSSSYLLKDILIFENIKKADVLVNLLRLLAMQIGNLVSYHEIATALKISSATVERYIDLLEKSFVIFRLTPLSGNLRNEIGKKNKIYFYDLGIRNSLIQQYQSTEFRLDKGAIWENFVIVERLKWLQANNLRPNRFFWRNHQQVEIDYIEKRDERLDAYEIKWQDKRKTMPVVFQKTFPNAEFMVIHKENFDTFITD
ncbi:MAG: ATP-binding protein [Saprospiraceae bacterium]|nr:ATP-binding protein [Saprospiraceae bacterium]